MQGLLLQKNGKVRVASSIAARVYGGYVWSVFTLIVLAFGSLSILIHRPAFGRRIARRGARLLFYLARIRIAVKGVERLPAEPHVLVLNHASFLDGIALIALLPAAPGYTFAVRQEFRSQALLYPLLKSVGMLVLHRFGVKPAVSDVARMASFLKGGERLIVFPEGGFRPEPGLQSFHSGAFAAAAEAGVPVVTAALFGARRALPPGTWVPRHVPIYLRIGDVLYPDDDSRESVAKMTSQAQAAISSMLSDTSLGE